MRKDLTLKAILRKNNANFAQTEDNSPNYLGYGVGAAGIGGVGGGAELYRRRALRNNPNYTDPTGLTSRNQTKVERVKSQIGQDFSSARKGLENQGKNIRQAPGNAYRGVRQDIGNVGQNYNRAILENSMPNSEVVNGQIQGGGVKLRRGGRFRAAGKAGRQFLGTNTGKVGLGLSLLGAGAAGYGMYRGNQQNQ